MAHLYQPHAAHSSDCGGPVPAHGRSGDHRRLRVITCALLGLDVRLFRERIAQPVAAVTMFVVTSKTAQLTVLGDRSHLTEELKNQEGT